MRGVAGHAPFAQRLVFKDKGARLLAMTLGAGFIQTRHRQASRRLQNLPSVRIMALHAVHPSFRDRVVLREIKFRVGLEVALKADLRGLARIYDMPAPSPTHSHM